MVGLQGRGRGRETTVSCGGNGQMPEEGATLKQPRGRGLHLLPDLHLELGPEDSVRSVPLAAPATDRGVCLRSDPMAVWPTAFPSAANPYPRCGLDAGTQDSFHQNEHLQLRPIPRTASSCERWGGSSDRVQGPSQAVPWANPGCRLTCVHPQACLGGTGPHRA